MKLGLVKGVKMPPRPQLEGVCAYCGSKLIAKCGDIKLWHWAHYSKRDCDIWWENETEWHRNWKGYFPIDWQEVVHFAVDGEKHIADVKTSDECIIEFQHSFITNDERLSRNNFYKKIVWIVDGLRRKRDKDQFFNALDSGTQIVPKPLLLKVHTDDCKLFGEWKDCNVPVFFDFGEEERIWWLMPFKDAGWSYVVPFSRQNFIDIHLGELNINFMSFLNKCIQDYQSLFNQMNKNRQRQQLVRIPRQVLRIPRYSRRRRRSRRL